MSKVLNERWIAAVDADIKAHCPQINGEPMVSWEFAKAAIRGQFRQQQPPSHDLPSARKCLRVEMKQV